MQSENQNTADMIFRELSALYPDYPEKAKKNPELRKLDWELCNQGAISEVDLISIYSKSTGLEVRDEEEVRDMEILPFPGISTDYLLNWACLPVSWTDSEMGMLVCEPYSLSKMSYFIRSLYGRKVNFSLVRRSLLERKINSVYEKTPSEQETSANQFLQSGDNEETLRSLASEAAIVRLVNETFTRAIESEASDIHIEPEETKLVIRFRIDGMLHLIMTTPLSQYPAIVSRIKLVGGLNIAERRLPQDGRTNLKLGRYDVDVRISTIPTMNGESVVLRLLRKDAMTYDLKNIGMNEKMRQEFERIASLPYGIILVVGPTGSGKTTLISLIMRFYDCPKGAILLDGEDVREFTVKSVRRHIALVSQETLLFNDSIRNNLSFGLDREVSDDELIVVAKKARIYDLIASLPDGIDTEVGDRGIKLSGGEKQRVAIARALLKGSSILILDEATSSLDSKTESLIQDAVDSAIQNKTAIIIAHRLSTIKNADKIVVVEGGRVVEEGGLVELLEKKGKFYGYWQAQKFS
ncbi:MAG: ATPase, T2SS/T4P/T4SS family [Candidatus Omnitrophota bacterium]